MVSLFTILQKVKKEEQTKIIKIYCNNPLNVSVILVIPKQAFIGWLVMLNRLSTKVRMLNWGFNADAKCTSFLIALFLGDHVGLS